MLFDWGDLEYFLGVAEAGSLSGAAKEMGVSQPTVGRRLDSLEGQLGSKLFIRTAQGMKLTDMGDKVLDHAMRVRDETSSIARAAQGRDTGLEGTVRVSTVEGIADHWLTPHLGDFRLTFPNITLEILAEHESADLINREADMAIRMYRPTQNSLITRRIATIGYGYYGSETYLRRRGTPRNLADFKDHDIVCWVEDVPAKVMDESYRIFDNMPGRPVYRTNSPGAMVAAIVAGIGIGRVPNVLAAEEPTLHRLLPDRCAAELDIWLVAHTDLKNTARIRALWDYIVERAASIEKAKGSFG